MKSHLMIGVALISAGWTASANAAKALGASVFQNSHVGFDVNGHDGVSDPEGPPAISGLPNEDLTTSTFSTISDGVVTLTAHGSISAHWDDANSGTVNIFDRGWKISSVNFNNEQAFVRVATGASQTPDWNYSFQATSNGTFDLTSVFQDDGGNSDFGLGSWFINITDNFGEFHTVNLHADLSPGSNDTVHTSFDLLEGRRYSVSIFSQGGVSFAGISRGDTTGAEKDMFSWKITEAGAVPEPASWALMLTGFMGVGGALRVRRRVAVA